MRGEYLDNGRSKNNHADWYGLQGKNALVFIPQSMMVVGRRK